MQVKENEELRIKAIDKYLKTRDKLRSLTQNSNFLMFDFSPIKIYDLICKVVSTNTIVCTKEKEYVVPCDDEKIFTLVQLTCQVLRINVKSKWCMEEIKIICIY